MTTDPDSPRVLARLRTEADAQLLVDHLESRGIHALLSGSQLMSAWPEVPADVQVLVRQSDLEQAQRARDAFALVQPRVR